MLNICCWLCLGGQQTRPLPAGLCRTWLSHYTPETWSLMTNERPVLRSRDHTPPITTWWGPHTPESPGGGGDTSPGLSGAWLTCEYSYRWLRKKKEKSKKSIVHCLCPNVPLCWMLWRIVSRDLRVSTSSFSSHDNSVLMAPWWKIIKMVRVAVSTCDLIFARTEVW